jgi:ATP-dependent DNA helicase DinG
MDKLIYKDFWCRPIPMILTSGTMSVNGCFSHIKRNMGIAFVIPDRISEASKKSPFNYKENSLIYISSSVPFPDSKNPQYIKAVADEIEKLVRATHGNSLVLFTSYKVHKIDT